jgi:hypothetical protein
VQALHKGFERDLAGKDAVLVSCSPQDFNASKIVVMGKDPPDGSFSVFIHQCPGIDFKLLEDRFRNESKVDSISLFFRKPVQLGDGESHKSAKFQ